MKPTSWEQAKDVITEALKRAPSQREQFVRERCADSELAGEIITLLAAYRDSRDFLAETTAAAEPVDEELEPGTRVGPYVIVDSIGRGGMGHVFLGSDSRLRRKVALKCVIKSLAGSGERRLRILHEARAAARVMHPNVATVHDIVEHENRAFIVMEYVEGESLASRLKRERLPIDRVVAIGRQLAAALTAAHAKGVVHRDLKPGNVHFTIDGTVKVLDFGIANAPRMATTIASGVSTMEASMQPTTPGPHPGTPPYMSPEQLLGRAVDERTDIYSLGVVLFEMATGRRPYRDTEAADLVIAVANGAPRADAVDPRVPAALADVIARALAVDADERYQSAADVGAALELVEAELKEKPRGHGELIRRWVTRVAIGILMAPPALISLGYLNSVAFNITMTRTGAFAEFGRESVADYLYWGLKSIIPPIGYIVVATFAITATRSLLRLLMLSPVVGGALTRVRNRIARLAMQLTLDDPVVLAQALATLGIVAIALVVWWFRDVSLAWTSFINTSPVEWLRPLNPHNPDRALYRLVMTLVTAAFGVGLARVITLRRRRQTRHGLGALMLLGVTVAVMVVLADMPYRLFSGSEFERVDYGNLRCYDIGRSGDNLLVYCPEVSPPRNRVVSRSDPTLRRLGIMESVFTLQPSSRSGS